MTYRDTTIVSFRRSHAGCFQRGHIVTTRIVVCMSSHIKNIFGPAAHTQMPLSDSRNLSLFSHWSLPLKFNRDRHAVSWHNARGTICYMLLLRGYPVTTPFLGVADHEAGM